MHKDAVYGYAVSLVGVGSETDDLVQETFLGLLRRSPALKGQQVRTYLLRCVRNRFIDRCRRVRRENGEVESLTGSEDPEALTFTTERAREVRSALDALPETEGEVVRLRVYGRLGYEEIGAMLEIPSGTARTRYRRALDRLRSRLKKVMRDA